MIKRAIIANFGSASTGGPISVPQSDITIPRDATIHGIRIAADSHIDVVDLVVDGQEGKPELIRVAAGAPYIGNVSGNYIRAIQARPSRTRANLGLDQWSVDRSALADASSTLASTAVNSDPTSLFPLLIVEMLLDVREAEEERLHPTQRAPLTYGSFVGAADSGLGQSGGTYEWWFPAFGRSALSVGIHMSGAGTWEIYGVDDLPSGARDLGSPTSGTAVATGTASAQWTYEGPPYSWIVVRVTPAAAQSLEVVVTGEDA